MPKERCPCEERSIIMDRSSHGHRSFGICLSNAVSFVFYKRQKKLRSIDTTCRNPRAELNSYQVLPTSIKQLYILIKRKSLKIYSTTNREEEYDQLVMKCARKLKSDVNS